MTAINRLRIYLVNLSHRLHLPGAAWLAQWLLPAEIRHNLEALGVDMAAAEQYYTEKLTALQNYDAEAVRWFAAVNIAALPVGRMQAIGGIETLFWLFDDDLARIATALRRYATDQASFATTTMFGLMTTIRLEQQGHVAANGVIAVPAADQMRVRIVAANEWTRELTQAKPGQWDYDQLLTELKALIFHPAP